MSETNNNDEYKNLEKLYLQKLGIYTIQHKLLIEEYSKYINNINTSAKNKNFIGQNVFVNELDSAGVSSSFYDCQEVNLDQWEQSSLPSSLTSYETCKDYAINKNKQFFGVQELDKERRCYVKQGNVKDTYITSGGGIHKQYWKSDKGNANANILVLGFDGIISLIEYTSTSWWDNSDVKETYWSEGEKYKNCDQIWGGTITGIKGVFGKNCKDDGHHWSESKGIDHVNEVFAKKLLHTQGGNILINNDYFGGSNYDPCKGYSKKIQIQYMCGDTNSWDTIKSSENSYVDVTCNKVIKNCPSYYGDTKNLPPILKLTDDGDLCIFKSEIDETSTWCLSSTSSDVNNIKNKKKIKNIFKSGWANDNGFNIHPPKPLIQNKGFNNVSWLYDRDYIRGGEPFQTGMLLASKSGNCCMVLQDDGYLYLYYGGSGCKEIDGHNYGTRSNTLGISKIDTKRPMSINNLGKAGYVIGHGDDKGKVKQYPTNMLKFSSKFSKVDDNTLFNDSQKNIKQYSDLSLKGCMDQCKKMKDKCIGVTWTEPYAPQIDSNNFFEARPGKGTCYTSSVRHYDTLLGQKTDAKGRHTSYKLPKVINNNSCNSKNINLIDNSTWKKYDINNLFSADMSPSYLCGLGAITRESKKNLSDSYSALKEVVNNISDKLKTLTIEEETLLNERGQTVKKLKKYIKNFDAIQKQHSDNNDDFDRYKSLERDTRLNILSEDSKYIYWGLLAIIIIIIMLNLSK